MFLFLAVNFTTAINVALVNATQPILTVLIAWILIRDEIKNIQILGIVAAFIGITVMVTKADFRVLVNLDFNVGDFITVLATSFYSCYAINIRKMPKEIGTFYSPFCHITYGFIDAVSFLYGRGGLYQANAVFG